MRARIVTVVNQKGGVGKTTITCNLAFAAAEAGLSVLVVDFDTQGNTSQILLQDPRVHEEAGGAEEFWRPGIRHADLPARASPFSELLAVIHGHSHLDAMDREDGVLERAVELRQFVASLPYDRIILDTPPSIGPRQIAPMLWADMLLVPVEPTALAMSGLPALMETIGKVKRVNRALQIAYAINRIKSGSREQKRQLADLRQRFGAAIMAELPDRVAVADSLAECRPAWRRGHAANRVMWRAFTERAMAID